MLIAHAFTLGMARTCLASLADHAHTVQASSAYERVLIELDRLHGEVVPAIDEDLVSTDQRNMLYVIAASSIEDLADHGLDDLNIELILAMLGDAFDQDAG